MKHLALLTCSGFRLIATSLLIATVASTARAQLLFDFAYGPGIVSLFGTDPVTAMKITAAMTAAGSKWSGSLADPITVKITVDLDGSLPSTAFAAAVGAKLPTSFTSVKSALGADALPFSATDTSAVASLQPGPKIEALTQDTSAPGPSPGIRLGGASTGIWNSTLAVTRPNLKALGLLPGTDGAAGADGLLKFNPTKFAMVDFTRGDGITAGLFDFTGIAIHELGHLMGFSSGVDEVDFHGDSAPAGPADLTGTAIFSVLDLYRYRSDTLAAPSQPPTGAVNDWRFGPPAGPSEKPYFSVDEGVTTIAAFSTGAVNGDGKQASHFATGVAGIMNPGFAPGAEFNPTGIDVAAMDAIGWNIVPEPSSALLLLGTLALAAARRRRA